jgi:hypothetical protein
MPKTKYNKKGIAAFVKAFGEDRSKQRAEAKKRMEEREKKKKRSLLSRS